MTEWNAETYKAFMQQNHLVESRAVKSFIREAAKQMRWVKIYSDYMGSDPNPVTLSFMDKADKDRQEADHLSKQDQIFYIRLPIYHLHSG